MAYPVAWLVIILVRVLLGRNGSTQFEVRRSLRVLLVKLVVGVLFFAWVEGLTKQRLFVAPILIVYFAPTLLLRGVFVPLGWPRVAYYFARVTWPLGFSDSDAVVACFYGAVALRGRSELSAIKKFETTLGAATKLDGAGLVSLGLLAAARGDMLRAIELFSVADTLHSRFISREARRVARDYLIAHAAERGAWQAVISLGLQRKPNLRWSYLLARTAQRLTRHSGAPSRVALYFWWLLAPRRRKTWPLVKRALGVHPAPLPAETCAPSELPEALARLAHALAAPTGVRTSLRAALDGVEQALASAATEARLERRLLGLSLQRDVDAILLAFRAQLVEMLVSHIEHDPELRGGPALPGPFQDACVELKQIAFRELDALCLDYRTRTKEQDSLSADAEWQLWARFRASGERLLRADPEAQAELFQSTFATLCNFAVFQHNQRKRLALAHSMYDWLHAYAHVSPSDSLLLARNLKAALS